MEIIKNMKFSNFMKDVFSLKDDVSNNDLIVEENNQKKVYEEYLEKYKNIFNNEGYDISIPNKEVVHIKGNGLDIIGNAVNTFWTAEDVLCKKDYMFYSEKKYIMIDIGLNIGLTSLSMARNENIVKIYGYEPFEPTFEQAKINMNRNPDLAKKIEIFKYGLGSKDEFLEMNYNPERPGAMSSIKNIAESSQIIEKIEIKRASTVLDRIFLENNIYDIFVKMDCEGAEKSIIMELRESDLLQKINLFVLEWHFEYPQDIIKILTDNHFIVFNKETVKNELGFITAIRYC